MKQMVRQFILTPVIGMVGLHNDIEKVVTPGFKKIGHKIAVLGKIRGDNLSLPEASIFTTFIRWLRVT